MAVVADSLFVCNARGFAVSRFCQADAPERCLSAYRASDIALADGRLFQKQLFESKVSSNVSISSREEHGDNDTNRRGFRSVEAAKRKRLKRNKKKRAAYKEMTKSERKARHWEKMKKDVEHEILSKAEQQQLKLKESLVEYRIRYGKEKEKKLKVYRYKNLF